MRRQIFFVLFCLVASAAAPGGAHATVQEQVQRFLASLTPPGAQTSFASLEESDGTILVRDIVAHAQSAGGVETVHHIGLLQMRGLTALPSGLFKLDALHAENIRIDGMSGLDGSGSGSIRIRTVTATDMDGARIKALVLSDIAFSAAEAGAVALRVNTVTLNDADGQALTRAAVRAHTDPATADSTDALLQSLLNSGSYGALHIRGVSVHKAQTELLSIAEITSEPDGAYAAFPASGKFAIRNASLDLRDPMAAGVRNWLGQDRLLFNLESRHRFSAPAAHIWDSQLSLAPDAELSGTCTAQNLTGFSPALIRSAQAAASNPATLRGCDLNFTGTQFVNRWLAQDGAKQGLTPEEARAKYLAGSLLVSLDPQTANDPLALQLITAGQIFLSQPSRLNIHLAPPGGLKFPDSVISFAMLMNGGPEQKQQAMQKLGLRIEAVPVN